MGDVAGRFLGVTPVAWVLIVLAALLNFGAKKWVELLKVPEEKQQIAVVIAKSVALVIAIGGFVLVLLST